MPRLAPSRSCRQTTQQPRSAATLRSVQPYYRATQYGTLCERYNDRRGHSMTTQYGHVGVQTTEELRDFPHMLDVLRSTLTLRDGGDALKVTL